jgi:HSP20 family protein
MNSNFDPSANEARTMTSPHLTTPACDVLEGPSDLVVAFDLPSVKEDGISLRFESGRLELDATQKLTEREAKWLQPLRFRATVDLPDSVDSSAIEASLESGVLTVRIAKSVRAQARSIAIKSVN